MAKKDYAQICKDIIEVVGGKENITNVSHCMTRLRLGLADGSKVDQDAAKKISGVLNLVVQNGEYQFVIGQDVPSLYEEFGKAGFELGGSVDDAEAMKADASAAKGKWFRESVI